MQLESHIQLLSRLGTICKHHRELSRLSGSDFNIFKIIKVSENELKHSAFMAELLNPNGSHGQGEIFLQLFLQKLGIENFQCKTAKVEIEKHIGPASETNGGQIDIFIEDKTGNNITIENKIYANDQPNQLIRYHNYKQQNLFYLTRFGEDAAELSTKNEKYKIELKCGIDYKLLSYEIHILEWLELCQKEAVSKPLLREGIVHYINLIKSLTGKSINKAMKNEIVSLLTENPANLKNASELYNNFIEAKISLQWEFWEALKNALIREGIVLISENDEKTVRNYKVRNFYQKKEKPYGLWSKIYHKGEISIHWGVEIYESIHIGFTIENNGKGGISDLIEYEKYRNLLNECDINYKSTQWFIGLQYIQPPLDFKAFNSDEIFNLTNKKELEKTVNTIAQKAKKDIEFVKEKLSQLTLGI
jgi:hypothetical protein